LKDPVYRVFVTCMLGCSLACAQSRLPPALPGSPACRQLTRTLLPSDFVPFQFIVKLGLERGLSKDQGAVLVTCLGLSNTIGRASVGAFADKVGHIRVWKWALPVAPA